ncbi:hypothetical protein GCM10010259_28000 [Streptomyces daghestanicus]|uniref:Uncharacterized protein n=1 Tax=Streptomyces daghestanicus TaxID=66885 RepID=A0ABQ3Q9X3_9ACTN|nr:hypothetical protein GCM10010240_41340 [Streptomyces griseoviridis]GGU35833.1 hypothetical protein GCM10010259_28000 [Streptomyces daghestanicus]GHI34068.1 hypothetical protein Sdagh_57980 [Streptomyces daghestanicus]
MKTGQPTGVFLPPPRPPPRAPDPSLSSVRGNGGPAAGRRGGGRRTPVEDRRASRGWSTGVHRVPGGAVASGQVPAPAMCTGGVRARESRANRLYSAATIA